MKRKECTIEVKEKRENGGRILINTGSVDRDKDRVMPMGAKLDNYRKNPVVQWGHNYRDPWATIGRTISLDVSKDGIVADFELRPPANEHDPQNIVRLLWDGGWIRTASVGFDPFIESGPREDGDQTEPVTNGAADAPEPEAKAFIENEHGGYDFTAWELLEWSLVPIPANQEALRLAVKGLAGDADPDADPDVLASIQAQLAELTEAVRVQPDPDPEPDTKDTDTNDVQHGTDEPQPSDDPVEVLDAPPELPDAVVDTLADLVSNLRQELITDKEHKSNG